MNEFARAALASGSRSCEVTRAHWPLDFACPLRNRLLAAADEDFAAAPIQGAMAQHHMDDLDRRIHKLASSGLPWINPL